MVTRLGLALPAILLTIAGGAAMRASGAPASSVALNSPQQARVIPIPTQPASAAKLLRRVLPKYPPEAKKKGIQGTVRLSAVIGKDGHVKKLRIVSGLPILVEAAVAAVCQWVYEPTLLNGKPVEVKTRIIVVFSLTKHAKDKEKHG